MINYKRIIAFILSVILTFGVIIWSTPTLLNGLRLGLDLKGGFEILYEAEPLHEGGKVTQESLRQTARSLEKRVNALGTAEPEIFPEGDNRIRVRIAGVEDEQRLREILKQPAELTFRGPDGTIELYGNDFVEGAARVGFDELNNPVIQIEVKEKEKLRQVSEKLLGQPLAIYLDDTLLSAPYVRSVFTDGKAQIQGNYTLNEANELADIINLGALPLKLTERYTQSVGATLGQQSLEQTVKAGIIGSILILLFMLIVYRIPGIVASITLITYTWALLLLFYWMDATLTLPGIAAFVLGIGMAVDANIITYERLKEEIYSGKSLFSALRAGSRNSLRTILDANITTFIAAVVLFYIGTGAIMGFALTLMLSIGLSMVTNVFMSRGLLTLLIRSNVFQKVNYYAVKPELVRSIDEKEDESDPGRFDFVSHRKKFFTFSAVVTALGILSLLIFQLNFGVDFKAGTSLDVALGTTIDRETAEKVVVDAGFEPSTVTVGGERGDRVSLRFDRILDPDQNEVQQVIAAYEQHTGQAVSYEENTVDPSMARELAIRALIAVALASAGILIYIAVRFEWRFAVSAVIALLHNAFFVISIFSIFRLEVNLTFIAAILTIIGYTINDTVVIFDRVRENLATAKIKTFDDITRVVNRSINQTLTRTLNTGITVLMASVMIMVMGSQSIFLFSLAMTIGLLVGMYTSVFIASQLWLWFKQRTSKSGRVDAKA